MTKAKVDNYEPRGPFNLTKEQLEAVENHYKPLGWRMLPKCDRCCKAQATVEYTLPPYTVLDSKLNYGGMWCNYSEYYCDSCSKDLLLSFLIKCHSMK